ncbi:MAG TPA: DEAD/DEAH box helicase, partial [Burkholderiales bacterium]|nr:DEAD/DEAH box helicase [Burkholderiales bacterium]
PASPRSPSKDFLSVWHSGPVGANQGTFMSFSLLGLDSTLLSNLTRLGYTEPTPVQREAIPAVLAGDDLLVSSQTGSGKTAAFVLPGLQRLRTAATRPGIGPRMLVLTPTRELALQVQKATHGYCSGQRLLTACLVGGMPFSRQLDQVRKPVDIVIATPGRLKDHMDRGSVELSRVEILVLDEADRMLDMGFQEEIDSIIGRAPKERQTLLFSATLAGVVGHLAGRVTRSPKRVEIVRREETKPDITQHALIADNDAHKDRLLDCLLREVDVEQALVFTAMKRTAADLTLTLIGKGFTAAALHGDMHQSERARALKQVRDGKMRVLVATDVAARGIDVPGINLVVNYDAPRQAEDYVHRIGRTGRAGRAGIAVTFLGQADRHLVRQIERFTGNRVSLMEIPGLEPKTRGARPPARGRGGRQEQRPRYGR